MKEQIKKQIDAYCVQSLQYGYASKQNTKIMDNKCPFDKYYEEFLNTPFPSNNSDITIKELKEIEVAMQEHGEDKNIFLIDTQIENYYIAQLKKIGIQVDSELIYDLNMSIAPLYMKLKYHYQRPRPFQLGWVNKIAIMPNGSSSADSPAYPSGHGGQSRFIMLIMSDLFPEHKEWLMKLSDYVAHSRVAMGVHYPSDNAFGQAIAEYLSKTDEYELLLNEIAPRVYKVA